MKQQISLKRLIFITIFAGLAIIGSLIEIPWIPTPATADLKIDLGEVVILVSLFLLGAKDTTAIVLIKSLTRRLFKGFDPVPGLIGEAIALVASLSIILVFVIVSKVINRIKTRPLLLQTFENDLEKTKYPKKFMIECLIITPIVLASVMFLFNFLVATPIYLSYFTLEKTYFNLFSFINHSDFSFKVLFNLCFVSYIPFNLVKGVVTVLIAIPIVKILQDYLLSNSNQDSNQETL
ncbi:MAG: ECF transporter S component [Acholeplasmatales bacterium]|nr:ECF transporter S component [Acholeplasmatales bacterium]